MKNAHDALQALVNHLESDPSLYDGDDDGELGRVMHNAHQALTEQDGAQEIWAKLTEVTVNEDEEIDIPFLHFPVGTHRRDVWSWIEDKFDVCVKDFMYPNETCRYCNGNCPNEPDDSEYLCDGFAGDIDGLYQYAICVHCDKSHHIHDDHTCVDPDNPDLLMDPVEYAAKHDTDGQ